MRTWVLLAAMGCRPGTGHEGVQVGGEGGPIDTCGREVVTQAAFDEVVLDGRTANDALALVEGPFVYQPTWYDGRSAAVTIGATPTGTVATVTDYPDGQEGCARRIAFPVMLSLSSEDGALDEQWETEILYSHSWTLIDTGGQIPIGELAGTLDVAAIAPDALELILYLRFGEEGDVGNADLVTANEDPGPSTGSEGLVATRTRVFEWDLRP